VTIERVHSKEPIANDEGAGTRFPNIDDNYLIDPDRLWSHAANLSLI
jgi:hypothetical protein